MESLQRLEIDNCTLVIPVPRFAFEFVRIAGDKIEVQADELITNRQDGAFTEL